MKVLVIAQDGQIRDALEKQLTIRRREHLCVGPEWLDPAGPSCKNSLKMPEGTGVVVNAVSLQSAERGDEDLAVKKVEVLARACVKRRVPLIHLSSSVVYDGAEDGVHKETEAAVAVSDLARLLLRMEGVVSAVSSRHIVLRTGPLFSSIGDNLLTRLLYRLESEDKLILSDRGESCPIHAGDMARVVSAIIDQLSCGAEVWGTYHYCSADYVTHFQFAEVLWSAVSRYKKAVAKAPALEASDVLDSEWSSPLLSCEKILNTFGIKQLPWRSFIAPTVKKYFNPGLDPSEPLLTQSIQPVQRENFDG